MQPWPAVLGVTFPSLLALAWQRGGGGGQAEELDFAANPNAWLQVQNRRREEPVAVLFYKSCVRSTTLQLAASRLVR